jgi:tetratricopeptide (TPR) repeat protein
MADGDYAAASEMFKALGDYEDSADQAKECDYQIAKAAFDAGDYENAIELLTALGDYQDSADLISQATDKIITAKLVGNWVSDDIDVTDIFVTAFNSALNPDSADAIMADVDLGTVTMTLTIEVTDKGSFYLKVDGQSLDATVDKVLAAFQVGFTKWVEDVYTELAADNNMTLDELLAYCEVDSLEALFEMDNNVSIEDFLATYFPKDQFIAIIDSVSSNGTYTVEDGVVNLTIASETETVIYDGEADTITMDGEGLSDGDVVFHRAA